MTGIQDPYIAFDFDRGVAAFGEALSSELESIEAKNKRDGRNKQMRIFRKWIPEASGIAGAYRDRAKEG